MRLQALVGANTAPRWLSRRGSLSLRSPGLGQGHCGHGRACIRAPSWAPHSPPAPGSAVSRSREICLSRSSPGGCGAGGLDPGDRDHGLSHTSLSLLLVRALSQDLAWELLPSAPPRSCPVAPVYPWDQHWPLLTHEACFGAEAGAEVPL